MRPKAASAGRQLRPILAAPTGKRLDEPVAAVGGVAKGTDRSATKPASTTTGKPGLANCRHGTASGAHRSALNRRLPVGKAG